MPEVSGKTQGHNVTVHDFKLCVCIGVQVNVNKNDQSYIGSAILIIVA